MDNVPKELLAIREQTDLRLMFRHGEFYERTGVRILQQYYSLHTSPASTGYTFKHTVELENGTVLDSVHTAFGIDSGKFSPIFAATPANLSIARYNAAIRPKDTRIDLGNLNPRTGNLVWAVVVSKRGNPFIPPPPFKAISEDFSVFCVTVVWAFVASTASDEGMKAHFVTGPPRTNRAQSFTIPVQMPDGLTAKDTADRIRFSIPGLVGWPVAINCDPY